MNTESDNMGLIPYNSDPEYSVEVISATTSIICTNQLIFQNVNKLS